MKTASISEVKNRLSALLDQVRHGETIVITDRGRPVARLQSVVDRDAETSGRLARLARAGAVHPSTADGPLPQLMRRPPRAKRGTSILRELLAERDEGR